MKTSSLTPPPLPSSTALTVLVLSYNHPKLTMEATRSAIASGPARVVLVHNGSEPEVVDALKVEFPSSERFEHVVLEKNRGFTGGVNAGFEHCFRSCEWVLFLSNDCLLIDLPQIPARPALVAPKVLLRATNKIASVGGGFDPARGHLVHFRTAEEFQNLMVGPRRYVRRFIPGCAFLVPVELYRATGGFDESMGTYWEDVDFSLRAESAGFPLEVNPSWLVRHKVGKTCFKNPLYTLYFFQRNRKRVSWKYASPSQRLHLLPRLAISWSQLAVKLWGSRRRDLGLLWRAIVE